MRRNYHRKLRREIITVNYKEKLSREKYGNYRDTAVSTKLSQSTKEGTSRPPPF